MNKLRLTQLIRKNVNLPLPLVERIYLYSRYTGYNFTTSMIILLNESLTNFEKNNWLSRVGRCVFLVLVIY